MTHASRPGPQDRVSSAKDARGAVSEAPEREPRESAVTRFPRVGAAWAVVLILFTVGPAGGASPPRTFVELPENSLRLEAGKPVPLTLVLPGKEDWNTANIAQLQLRSGGRVQSLRPDAATERVSLRIDRPGLAMLIVGAGPSETRDLRDSATRTPYSAKILLRVEPGAGGSARALALTDPGMTAKVAMKVEIRPYLDPTRLRPDLHGGRSELPVKVYVDGSSTKHVLVSAHAPDGSRQDRKTDGHGVVRFDIDAPGRWLLRHEHEGADGPAIGDLVFEVVTDREKK